MYSVYIHTGVPDGSDGIESACNARDLGLTPGSGRSPREGNGYPLQYSCLENSMDSIHTCVCMCFCAVDLKLTQNCKSTILQFKKKIKNKPLLRG